MERFRRGFTLIELLVVVAIMAVLAAILFPVFARVREQAWQATCVSHQKELGTALLMYLQDFDETFPPTDYEDPLVGRLTWPSFINPYIRADIVKEVGSLEEKSQRASIFVCPSVGAPVADPQWERYNGPVGSRPFLSYASNSHLMPVYRHTPPGTGPATRGPVHPLAVVGTPARLVLFVENLGTIPNANGRDDRYNAISNRDESQYALARMRHSGGGNVTFVDGHVKWFRAPGNYRAQSLSGVCWQSPQQGARYADCTGWFVAISD